MITGPGRRATVYHIVGDLISSHMSPDAANVIRIKKSDSVFGNIRPHDSTNILASSGEWRYATADEEDQLYQQWFNRPHIKYIVNPLHKFFNYTNWLRKENTINNPIPGSQRWYEFHPNETSPLRVSPEVQEINDTAQKNLADRKRINKYKQLYLTGGGSSRQFN